MEHTDLISLMNLVHYVSRMTEQPNLIGFCIRLDFFGNSQMSLTIIIELCNAVELRNTTLPTYLAVYTHLFKMNSKYTYELTQLFSYSSSWDLINFSEFPNPFIIVTTKHLNRSNFAIGCRIVLGQIQTDD